MRAETKKYLLAVLFFGGLWGISEALLGGALYRAHIPYASSLLTVIAFVILTAGRAYLPIKGSSIFIGSAAMLFKFLNRPFFACHLLAILLLGLSYELLFDLSKKNKALFGLTATYLGYLLFSVIITYVVRYHFWVEGGLPRILRYVGLSGSIAALANFFLVPVSFRLFSPLAELPQSRPRLAGSLSFVTILLWTLAVTKCF